MNGQDKIRNLAITVLVVVLFIVATGTFIGDFTGYPYNKDVNTTFMNQSRSYSRDLNKRTDKLQNVTENFKAWNPIGWVEGAGALANILTGAGQVTINFFAGLPNIFGQIEIPGYLFGIIVTIITIVIVFELISMFFKYKV